MAEYVGPRYVWTDPMLPRLPYFRLEAKPLASIAVKSGTTVELQQCLKNFQEKSNINLNCN